MIDLYFSGALEVVSVRGAGEVSVKDRFTIHES